MHQADDNNNKVCDGSSTQRKAETLGPHLAGHHPIHTAHWILQVRVQFQLVSWAFVQRPWFPLRLCDDTQTRRAAMNAKGLKLTSSMVFFSGRTLPFPSLFVRLFSVLPVWVLGSLKRVYCILLCFYNIFQCAWRISCGSRYGKISSKCLPYDFRGKFKSH